MERKKEYYYSTPSQCDYSYEDYLEYCECNEIEPSFTKDDGDALLEWAYNMIDWNDEPDNVKWQFADMIRDIIDNKDISIDDIFDMFFYIKSNAVGWRRVSAHSEPKRVEDIIDLMGDSYEDIEFYRESCEDGNWGYTLRMAGHDSTDYFDIIPFHEDFIVEIMDDMSDYMSIDDIVDHIGYCEFKSVKNMIAMVENIGEYDVEDMEFVINNLADGVDNKMLMNLLHKGE